MSEQIHDLSMQILASDLTDENKRLRAENARLADEVKRGQWVKCEERLPETSGAFQTFSDMGVFSAFFYTGPDIWGSRSCERVTHWRELPNPPKD